MALATLFARLSVATARQVAATARASVVVHNQLAPHSTFSSVATPCDVSITPAAEVSPVGSVCWLQDQQQQRQQSRTFTTDASPSTDISSFASAAAADAELAYCNDLMDKPPPTLKELPEEFQALREQFPDIYTVVSPPRCASTAFGRVFWENPNIGCVCGGGCSTNVG